MRPEFGQIRYIAYMVTDPVLLLIFIVYVKSHVRQHVNRFEDGEAILSATSEVIDLTTAGLAKEVQKQVRYIAGVDLVPHLLPLVAKDRIGPAGDSTHDNIGEIAMQFDRGVLWTGETTTAKDADRHLEVPPKLLAHHVSRNLRGPEKLM